jgi:cytoskeleton protein RodZ
MSESAGGPQPSESVAAQVPTSPSAVLAGEMLRNAREAAGMHIATLAVALKVPIKKLEALEAGRIDLLPDSVFVRALASSVCRTLKLDPAPILANLPQTIAPRLTPDEAGINTPFRTPDDRGGSSWFEHVSRPALIAGLVLVLGALVLIFLPQSFTSSPAPVSHDAEKTQEVFPLTKGAGSNDPASAAEPVNAMPGLAPAGPESSSGHGEPDKLPLVGSSARPMPSSSGPAAAAPMRALAPSAVQALPAASSPSPLGASSMARAGASAARQSASAPKAAASATPAVRPPASAAKPAMAVSAAMGALPASRTTTQAPIAPGTGILSFQATGQSWVEVTDAKGQPVLRRTLQAGESVDVAGVPPLAVVIGRADATRLHVRGKPFDLQPVAKDNVARFEIK